MYVMAILLEIFDTFKNLNWDSLLKDLSDLGCLSSLCLIIMIFLAREVRQPNV